VKEDKLLDLNRSQNSDSSKSYITEYNWKSLFSSVNCELSASFGVNYIDFIFFFYFFFGFTEVFGKNIFFFFFFLFLFWQCSRFLSHLACF
jgi:hypothetical protein